MAERKPILKIFMICEDHVTTENSDVDKLDSFAVSLAAPKSSLKVGLEDAKAKLKIKAFDDVIKHYFPRGAGFTIEVYPQLCSAPVPKDKTRQEPLNSGAQQ